MKQRFNVPSKNTSLGRKTMQPCHLLQMGHAPLAIEKAELWNISF